MVTNFRFGLIAATALIAFVAMGGSQSAVSGENDSVATIKWDPPTERENGDSLDPKEDIALYTVYCREDGASEWPDEGYEIEGHTDEGYHETRYSDLLPGTGQFQCTITSTDTEGMESARGGTDTVEFYVEPGAPSNLKIGF